jgi:lipopolysaccharide biosynthesis glycosyltransferase
MKRNVLVTLASAEYIDQAKQLFSSAYWNGGWDGDYLLLAHEIPEGELAWFRRKGIYVKECPPLYGRKIQRFNPAVLGKFYLFTEDLKAWKNAVFLDSDIIVKSPFGNLADIRGFAACRDFLWYTIRDNMVTHGDIDAAALDRCKKEYNLDDRAFNTGVMAFSTDFITAKTFPEIRETFGVYRSLNRYGEQLTFNLFFYRKWSMLPSVYNCYFYAIPYLSIWKAKAVNIHFITARKKPWLPESAFYGEWKRSLEAAELIDVSSVRQAAKWSRREIDRRSALIDVIEKCARLLRTALTAIAMILRINGYLNRKYPGGYWRI